MESLRQLTECTELVEKGEYYYLVSIMFQWNKVLFY